MTNASPEINYVITTKASSEINYARTQYISILTNATEIIKNYN